jgi:CMP-N,N'-diacetyllegionaminic acid synthase
MSETIPRCFMSEKILAIIPARGGSKGIPKKNIVNLAGKPLIAWTIEASLKSKYIDRTIVTSDDNEILSISKKYGSDILKRPDNLATDFSNSELVVEHAIDSVTSLDNEYDVVILLQPTSPLRTFQDIDKAIDIMISSNATAVISTCKTNNKVLKTVTNKSDGFIEGLVDNKLPFMRRQDLPEVYTPNGAIYAVNVDLFKRDKSFITKKTANYVMFKKYSADIDTMNDLRRAASLIDVL